MNELYYAGILICLWSLYKFDVVRRGKESLRDIVDIKKEITKHHLKERDELRNQVDTLVTACAKLESEILEMESEVALVEIEKTHLNDKINGLKSLISRMKNEQKRRGENFNVSCCQHFSGHFLVDLEPLDSIGQCITFDSGMYTEKEAIKQFEKLTGLKVTGCAS